MHKFVRSLITEWRQLGLPIAGETVVIAVSGGADSIALLAAMADLKAREKFDLDLIAAHFDHQLRGESSIRDQEFVRSLAEKLRVGFVTDAGTIQGTGNLEQNARDARYEFLKRTANAAGSKLVLTGHTM